MQIDTYGQQTQVLGASTNRVLRNTYLLLALSMVPTIAGAMLGVQMQFSFFAGSPLMGFLLFMGISFAFFWGIERNKNSGLGVALLLGFTFFMGLMLSSLLRVALGFSNGGTLIALAGGGTAAIFGVMATVATVSKRDFSGLGKFLFVGVIVLLLASVANIFFQVPALYLTISAIAVALFSAYILYDINDIVRGGETNYVTATLRVYLDVYNVFVNLLNLLMAFGGDRD
ncbi:MAG TPA: Bax inhibitor-1/YccA family protein [Rhodocyclaceae bacterium]|nr:Bax inhibitor-1/YccA family protein [Rhodocyclaceae bacterium]HND23634.1 Bax inhibitor-1/YccA family protein [Rhodocyclaceae bacterium]